MLNAAAALIAGEMAGDFNEGLKKASDAIDSGAARDKLEEVKRVSTELYRS